jgi:ribosomal 50S subunit-recycling heat shock protein
VLSAADVSVGDTIGIEFGDGEVRARVSDGTTGTRPAPASRKREPGSSGGNQGSLL